MGESDPQRKNDLRCTQFIYRSPRPVNSVDVERGYKKRGTRVISGNHISGQRHPMMSKYLVVRDPSLRGSSWFSSCFCYHCHHLYKHSTEWTLMAPVVYVDLNLEFDLGRTTCMQLEVFAQERQRRQTVTSSFCRTRKLGIIAFAFAAPPP